jgi:hypothetical protein
LVVKLVQTSLSIIMIMSDFLVKQVVIAWSLCLFQSCGITIFKNLLYLKEVGIRIIASIHVVIINVENDICCNTIVLPLLLSEPVTKSKHLLYVLTGCGMSMKWVGVPLIAAIDAH